MLNQNKYFDFKLTPIEEFEARVREANLKLSPEAKACRRKFLDDSQVKDYQYNCVLSETMIGLDDHNDDAAANINTITTYSFNNQWF